jgi:molecular chaperone GrpE (heat shock protein)
MPRRGSARAEALRRAHEAKAQRDVERMHREAQIEAALADYFQATAETERIRAAARRKAEDAAAEAEQAVARPLAAARDAVCRLRDLLGGNAAVAGLCGISAAAVRDILGAEPSSSDGGGAGHAA